MISRSRQRRSQRIIYTDDESGKVSVAYRRKDGNYGLIEVQ